MEVRSVDPRDTEREEYNPVYRVYFWQYPAYSDIAPEQIGYGTDEYEMVGATDVREVLEWADENAGLDRTFAVYAMLDRCEIRLYGRDPNRASGS